MTTLEEFMADFKASSLVDRICSKYDVIMIWVSGSNCIGLTDSQSDYDLGVLVADNIIFSKTEKTSEMYVYKKDAKEVQCIYNSFEDIKASPCVGSLAAYRHLGWAQFKYITEDHILYINPKYKEIVTTLIAHKDCIAKNAVYTFLKLMEPAIDSIENVNYISAIEWGKMLSHLCWCVEELRDIPHQIPALMTLKRLFNRHNPRRILDPDLLNYVIINLTWAKMYLAANISFQEDVLDIVEPLIKQIQYEA